MDIARRDLHFNGGRERGEDFTEVSLSGGFACRGKESNLSIPYSSFFFNCRCFLNFLFIDLFIFAFYRTAGLD